MQFANQQPSKNKSQEDIRYETRSRRDLEMLEGPE